MDKPAPVPDQFSAFYSLQSGDPLEAVFEQRGETTLPQFRPAHQNGT